MESSPTTPRRRIRSPGGLPPQYGTPVRRRSRLYLPSTPASSKVVSSLVTPRRYAVRRLTSPPQHKRVNKTWRELVAAGNEKKMKEETISTDRGNHRSCTCCPVLIVLALVGLAVVHVILVERPCAHDKTRLEFLPTYLREKVHGQHIAVSAVSQSVTWYLRQEASPYLLISFHGWTGVGKTYLASLVANVTSGGKMATMMTRNGLHGNEKEADLLAEIVRGLNECETKIVVIEELEMSSAHIVDILVRVLIELKGRVMEEKLIVFILTTSGSRFINRIAYDKLRTGGSRDDVTSAEMTSSLLGLTDPWFTELHQQGVLDAMVPFLPLEKRHVTKCILEELVRRGHVSRPYQLLEKTHRNIQYFPKHDARFAVAGCKKLDMAIDLAM